MVETDNAVVDTNWSKYVPNYVKEHWLHISSVVGVVAVIGICWGVYAWHKSSTEMINKLKTQYKQQQERNTNLTEKNRKKKGKIADLRKDNQELASGKEILTQRIAELNAQIDTLNAQINQLSQQSNIRELVKARSDAQLAITRANALNLTIYNLQQQLAQLQAQQPQAQ